MIYAPGLSNGCPIDQGDLVDELSSDSRSRSSTCDRPRTRLGSMSHRNRVLVLTQACDLAIEKTPNVTVAVVHEAQFIVEQGLLKPSDVRGPVRAGRVYGWYFLPASSDLGLNEMIVDLRQLHTVRLDLLTALAQRGQRRARLLSPYREHLAKHFADTFSRIGLPEPYETQD